MPRPRTVLWATWFTSAAVVLAASPAATNAQTKLDPERIAQIARFLPQQPGGVGPTIDDRPAWQAVARSPRFADVVPNAQRLLTQPLPELTDDLYLDFSRTGNRSRCQRVLNQRHGRLPALVLAECIENRGRFLPAIEASLGEICSEKTWVMPAHDRGLKNFHGQVNEIDLAVAAISWNLATVDYWLGDKLSPASRKLIRDQLQRRTLTPMESYINTGKPRLWWATGTNNWNAVCLAGVTGTALAMVESPQRRAFFVAAAEHDIQNFLKGFTTDGYCSEGIGYWNYGFGHYVLLAETLLQATGGKIDLLADPRIRTIALFGPRMEIAPGVYPAFADCRLGTRPDDQLMAFLSRRFALGMAEVESRGLLLAGGPTSSLFSLGVYGFANSATARPAAPSRRPAAPRDWFDQAGVLICRPDQAGGLGAALKGGHNAEHHNHNDVGSFMVTLAGATPLVDPGGEVYTARTFSKDRYQSRVLNSFGHPVPRIDGKLQRTGRSAAAAIVRTDFSPREDRLVLDLAAAYAVDGLKKLQRTFVFSRAGRGSLRVTDQVELDQPKSFETALITFSPWQRSAPNRLTVGSGKGAVSVQIDTQGKPFEIVAEEIHEDLSGGRIPLRLAIRLAQPVSEATVALTITPSDAGKP